MPRLTSQTGRTDETREEVLEALLHADRAQHDELGRTGETWGKAEVEEETRSHSSPREQGAAPIDLRNVDE